MRRRVLVVVAGDLVARAGPARAITYGVPDGTFHTDPAYDRRQSDPHDIAVAVFERPVTGTRPAELPEAGLLGRLDLRGQRFTTVGYGARERVAGGGQPYRLDTESARAFLDDYVALP